MRVAGFDGNGGVQAAGAWRLLMDQVDLMDQMDKRGAPRDNPRVCCAAVWFGAGADVPQGFACLMAAAVCGRRGRGACIRLIRPIRPIR